MTDLLTASQMRAIEREAIDNGRVSGLELMERAGRGVVEAIFEEWPELAGGRAGGAAPGADAPPPEYLDQEEGRRPFRALVLCGPGNNGGDGFVVARLLKARGGEVEVLLFGDADRLPPDARANHDLWRAQNPVGALADGRVLHDVDLVIDALFGIGQTRPLPDFLQDFAAHAALMTGLTKTRLVAIDIPSGLDSDRDGPLGDFQFFADLTVTFHRPKPCHRGEESAKRCGRVVVKDIGL